MAGEESVKKSSPVLVRGKVACAEVWTAFKTLSKDAKVVVCLVLGLLLAALICASTASDGELHSSRGEADIGTLAGDVGESIKKSYQKGLEEVRSDPEIQENLRELKKNSRKLGELTGELKGALNGMGF